MTIQPSIYLFAVAVHFKRRLGCGCSRPVDSRSRAPNSIKSLPDLSFSLFYHAFAAKFHADNWGYDTVM